MIAPALPLTSGKSNKLFRWSVVAALAGFIFGFDTVVISGANQPIQDLWHTSKLFHGVFIMSMALWGTVVGALAGGIPSQRYGRKKTLFWVGVLFGVSAIGSAVAINPYMFSFFRFVGGLGIGISSVVAPTYITEISTPATRGRLTAMYQFNIVFGILLAYLSNYFLHGVGGNNDWRLMLGVLAIPSAIYTVMVMGVPESPRWLITKKNDTAAAKAVLQNMGLQNVDAAIAEITEANEHEAADGGSHAFFTSKHARIIWLAFFIAFFNQLSGINFILYYAPQILSMIGLGARESLLNSTAIGGTNLLFTFVGLYLIDRLGRKTLMIIGSIGYIISLGMVAYAFKTHASAPFLMFFLLTFIASHAVGQGAVIWVFLSEIFPNSIRARGQSFGASVHWIFAGIITLVSPIFLQGDGVDASTGPWKVFLFLAGMMVLQLIWVLTRMPETKNVSLEELERKLIG